MSSKCNVKHPVKDYNLSPQTSDDDLYSLAVKEERFILTINFDDFRKLVKKNKPGVIGIQSDLTNEQIDKIVTKFVSGKKPNDYYGKALFLNK